MQRKRVMTGDRPTGKLHLGHWSGSIKNRLSLQDSTDLFLLIADLHTLTTNVGKESIQQMKRFTQEVVIDWLSCGIEPEKVTIYQQSALPQIYELNLLLGMLMPLNRLSALPSLKEMARNAQLDEAGISFGLMGYPVLQSADILLTQAQLVPVGKDNEAHIELTRDIARRFNGLYGKIFVLPDCLLSETASLVGTNGKGKMSKSADNAIFLSDNTQIVNKKIRKMYTDPNRVHATTPGQVENNPVFIFHDEFNPNQEEILEMKERYQLGTITDVEVKQRLAIAINNFLDPIREKRKIFENDPKYINDIIMTGSMKMRTIAEHTMEKVRDAMGLSNQGAHHLKILHYEI
ncbi:tryptophan--tRNA ligase [Candidatus Clavichlamydia salmonicola]|uniref:tryptophan--tRNA ligase n=1 Tax=Candidatus Clavichlamydia salmonicola TaxID=469812 RepID=UPI001891CB94|nr:tryptophan--tRNA ligase [Candidatus Clavichlamydia salmonicola]